MMENQNSKVNIYLIKNIYELLNGKGKEFSLEITDHILNPYRSIIIFEGEYINGIRNGKGKEYDKYNGTLIFEGEYLNGKRNGKGKEYNEFGKLLYDGEYLNGKKNGKGKAYNQYGELEFKGEFMNGQRIYK